MILEQLLAERDKAWARVCRVQSTRWDLTKFERADTAYRAECERTGTEYVEIAT